MTKSSPELGSIELLVRVRTKVLTKDKKIHQIDNIITLNDAKLIYDLMADELYGKFAPK